MNRLIGSHIKGLNGGKTFAFYPIKRGYVLYDMQKAIILEVFKGGLDAGKDKFTNNSTGKSKYTR